MLPQSRLNDRERNKNRSRHVSTARIRPRPFLANERYTLEYFIDDLRILRLTLETKNNHNLFILNVLSWIYPQHEQKHIFS